jgi:hypothetical protein
MEEQENEIQTAPDEDKNLVRSILDLQDEESSITVIDMDLVSKLLTDIEGASTTKRLCNIDDVTNRFNLAFLYIERFQGFTKAYEDLIVIFGKMRSDVELDYFKAMSREVENDESVSAKKC